MANRDMPFGLRPVGHFVSGTPLRMSRYRIASAYDTSIGLGDPVTLVGTHRRIARGTAASAPFVGVFAGVKYTATNGEFKFLRYWPADTVTLGSGDAEAMVYDDPFTIFEVQADEDIVEADIGQHADLVFGTVDTVTGNGKVELDSSNIGTGDNVAILDIVRRDENEIGVANTKVHVMINEHEYRNAGANSFTEV